MIFRALALRQIKGQGANALTKGARKITLYSGKIFAVPTLMMKTNNLARCYGKLMF